MPSDFHSLPWTVNAAAFGGACVVVWIAGTRLALYADAISSRTRLSKAFVGLILLGVATSLPEIVTTITGALLDNPRLVAGNLFGGVAMQIAILALVDLVAVRRALTFFTPEPVLLFQGVMLLLLLAIAIAGAAARDPLSLFGFGLTPAVLAAGYVLMVRWSRPGDDHLPRWRATHLPPESDAAARGERRHPLAEVSPWWLYARSAVAALAILVAGWTLAQTGDAISAQTGLGASFVGVALVASSTSLPELSTALAAVRQGNHQMAVSNILGTNCLEMALFLVGDAAYRRGPILAETDTAALFSAAVGMVVTAIYLLGLLERRDRTLFRMGYDSVAVLGAYALGLAGVYFLG